MKLISFCLVAVFSLAAYARSEVVVSNDGQIRTLQAALDAVRAERVAGKAGPVTIRVMPGRYSQRSPLALTAADSSLTIRAEKPGTVVFDGARELPPFTVGADGVWHVKTPAGLEFSQLYVNGTRATRARSPNKFYYYMTEPVDDELADNGRLQQLPYRAFIAESADIAPLKVMTEQELSDVHVIFWQSWDQGFAHVEAVDSTKNLVKMRSMASRELFYWKKYRPRYALENFRAALDAPGEWYHDRRQGELLYIPRPGENAASARAVVPVAPRFVVIAGDAAKGEVVRDVVFENLGFEYSSWLMPANGVRNGQAAATVHDAAFDVSLAEGVKIRNCAFRHLGLHGVWFGEGCRNCGIYHSLVEDMGAGGVYVGSSARGGKAAKVPATSFITVDDCIIRHGGYELNAGIGLWSGHAADCVYTHNEIADFRYSGVSIGWVWGYGPSVSQRNFLGFNHIHHIGQGVLSDMGGVYTLGDSRGTVVTGNYIHDVNGFAGCGSPAWGLYTDEGSQGIVWSSNVVERVRDGAVHQHYGRNNIFTHNVFVGGANALWRSRLETENVSAVVTNNIICWDSPEAGSVFWQHRFGRPCTLKDMVVNSNLYWMPGGFSTNAFNYGSWEAWRAAGMDADSQIKELKFRDPAHGDRRLVAGATPDGFAGVDVSTAGVRGEDPAWRALAASTQCPALEDAPPAPIYVRANYRANFENRPLGTGPGRAGAFNMTPEAVRAVKVVKGGAREGERCLEMTDGDKFTRAYDPHLNLSFKVTNGVKRIRFSLSGDAAAKVLVECRDYGEGGAYSTGALVNFHDGRLTASGRRAAANGRLTSVSEPLVKVMPGQWVDVEMLLTLSGEQAGTWICTASAVNGEKHVSSRFNVLRDDFRELDWVGFISPGTVHSVWRLDDFEVSDP